MVPKRILTVLVIAILVLAGAIVAYRTVRTPPGAGEEGPRPMADWTVMFYFDGDNNLGEYKQFLFNLECLKKVGSTDRVHLVVLIDRQHDGDTKVHYVEEGNTTEIPLSEVNANWTDEVNVGDPATLVSFVRYCATHYPAHHYNLKLSDHGGGWRGICWDDTNGEDHLDLPELETALTEIDAIIGGKLDILSTEACLVGMAEFAYQISDLAHYYVGSEAYSFGGEMYDDGTIVVGNWVYDRVYGRLVEDPSLSPEAFARVMIEEFNTYGPWSAPPAIPKTQSSDTLSVFNLTHLAMLGDTVDALAEALLAQVTGPGGRLFREAFINAVGISETPEEMHTESFSGMLDFIGISSYTNYDLYDLCVRLSESALLGVDGEAAAVMEAVERVIVIEHHGTDASKGEHPDAHGVAIYLPYRNTEYNANYEQIAFAKDTQWDELFVAIWLAE